MNVLLVSQCDKRALTETRRILDQFAERRGDRAWQTPITQAGLDTLRKLLRRTARKNTAVACHWIRGLDHSELLWIVGDARRFNAEGAVPTNTTARNVLRREDENDWHTAEDIRLLAQLAALLHDLGKASVAFQERLQGKRTERNLYRHEWVSLRMFQAFVGSDDDEGWLRRLADPDALDEQDWISPGRYQRDGLDAANPYPFRQLPPLAAAVAWLVLTHHRLPVAPARDDDGKRSWWGRRVGHFERAWLDTPLAAVAHDWNEIRQPAAQAQAEPYWQPAGRLPVAEAGWRTQAARLGRRLLALRERRGATHDWTGNVYVMHLARLSLMLADHHYSSLGVDKHGKPVPERQAFLHDGHPIAANTRRDGNGRTVPNQSLVEHLLGVGHAAGLIAHALPDFEHHLPRLANHRGLRKRSADPRFGWQDKAFDAALCLREAASAQGAFIVNMASTGCGKTLANARILYALSDPQRGLRATYALGLRTLTLQTGRSYRHDLHLGEDELAVLVGGSASRTLFEFYEQKAEAGGSASMQALLEEDSHVLYDGNLADHPLLSRALANDDIRRLVSAPMLVCTVDHLAPATESLRAGRQIAPMLRLMSSDLVLDELDDYDLDDLPALTRLVHWAALLGTRVLLSSATLPPALVEGMFMAYRAGRRQYQRNRGRDGGRDDAPAEVPCLWTDEYGVQVQHCGDDGAFSAAHAQFVRQRVTRLEAAPPLRRAELLPLAIAATRPEHIRAEFAGHVRDACLRLHPLHAETDPATGKRVSFGLVRMANIDPIIDVAHALHALGAPEGTRIHLCVYHARFPLAQRSAIEFMLDNTLDRRDARAVWRQPAVRAALDTHAERDHLFVVLASPVCEVGRDWDASWAVAEPSSMRSLIQLAGRVQRHRRMPPEAPNVLVFDTNLKHFEQRGTHEPVFVRPGFEKATQDGRFLLASHSLRALLDDGEYRRLDAVPRIQPRPVAERQPTRRWVDLEQARLCAGLLPQAQPSAATSSRRAATAPALERDQSASSWQFPQASLIGVLPQQQPFREHDQLGSKLVFLPDAEEEALVPHRVEDDSAKRGESVYVPATELLHRVALESAPGIGPWGEFDLMALLAEHADALDLTLTEAACKLTSVEVPRNEQGWRWHPSLGIGKRK
ncbi:type I-F CRISPR-associated helicase Cas3 [Frateuria sp. Soil773]|uniref:type I-F CRISPR-associated helicase Cas3f n=1 Tax=Frateuria sp. Soil773 TaxID=1736407 RepID=UPI0006F5D91B|nr:type I-F CRISPR-associated helicase Cas3f [Frateuria sp. Soil773]KRE92403.1 type I-F CRISPR-associated helicase Cas3 [Frateuria sp. Soil773]